MILKTFKIPLSRKQGAQVRREWSKYGPNCGLMLIAQPIATWGPFEVKYPDLSCAILDNKTAEQIDKVIKRAKKERVKESRE